MSDCIPNADNTACVNCGWEWTHPEICEWPHRNCPKSPDLVSAAAALGLTVEEYQQVAQPGNPEQSLTEVKAGSDKLGVTWRDALHYAAAVVKWTKAGCSTREQTEVERIERDLCRPCAHYREGRCDKCGCQVTASSIALVNKIKMGTESCPKGKW